MTTPVTGLAALILFAAASGTCNAQIVVKKEPLDMRNGATVLVDDGTCPEGDDQARNRNARQRHARSPPA